MTDKPITQADLDAFRAEIVEAFRKIEDVRTITGDDITMVCNRLATPPKPRPELPTMEDWRACSARGWLSTDECGLVHNLMHAIVSGSVDLPRYKEER